MGSTMGAGAGHEESRQDVNRRAPVSRPMGHQGLETRGCRRTDSFYHVGLRGICHTNENGETTKRSVDPLSGDSDGSRSGPFAKVDWQDEAVVR